LDHVIKDTLVSTLPGFAGAVLEHAWKLQDRYRLSFGDSLIVAAAKAASCGFLLTEDFQDGEKLDGVEVLNPFLREPASVL